MQQNVRAPTRKGKTRNRKGKKAKRTKTAQVLATRVAVKRPKAKVQQMSDSGFRAYNFALRNPFDPRAIGARVPDSYAFPTVTYHFRQSWTITTGTSGEASGLILPSPCMSYIHRTASSSTVTGPTAFTNNTMAYYCVAPADLSSKLTEYRVSGWGVRILAKDTAFASKGKLWVATVPTTNNAPSWNTLETVTASGAGVISEYCAGLDLAYPGGIVNLPTVKVFSMQDLLRGELQVTGTPLDPSFYTFKGTSDRSSVPWNTGQVLADEGVFNNTTGLVNATAGGRKDIASLRGGMAVYYYITGAPASTNEVDIEVIYHVEGTPNVSSASGATSGLIPSSQMTANGSTATVERMIGAVRAAGSAISMITSQAGATQGVVQAALGAARAIPLLL